MEWWRPLKLDIWFRTFKDARIGKFHFLDIKQPSSKSSAPSSAYWLNEYPSSSSSLSPSSLSSSPARYLEIVFFVRFWLCYWMFVSTFVTMITLGLLAERLWDYLNLYKLLFSLLHAKKLKWFMNSKRYISNFLFSLFQRSVSRLDSKETLFNNTFLFTCLMTEPVVSSFVPTKGNTRGKNNCSLGIVGLCYAQSNYVFKVAVVH